MTETKEGEYPNNNTEVRDGLDFGQFIALHAGGTALSVYGGTIIWVCYILRAAERLHG